MLKFTIQISICKASNFSYTRSNVKKIKKRNYTVYTQALEKKKEKKLIAFSVISFQITLSCKVR